jgi:hypothetical protein
MAMAGKKNSGECCLTEHMTKFQRTFHVLLLAFLSILSVSGTIALRNLLHLVLLAMLSVYLWLELRRDRDRVVQLAKAVPLPVVMWCAYLLLFPLIAPDRPGALDNLIGKGMWGESILTWILAWGAVLVLGAGRLGLWQLALASAVPVYIHLLSIVLAWAGVLQPAFYADPTLQQLGASMLSALNDFSLVQDSFKVFPMGFRGIEPMHGNLGYPASQATALALAVAYLASRNSDRLMLVKAICLIAACFVSVVIAQSRAATYFGLFLVGLSFFVYSLGHSHKPALQLNPQRSKWKVGGVLAVTLIISLTMLARIATTNIHWYSMWDKLTIGIALDSPMVSLCKGFDSSVYDEIRAKYADRNAAYTATLIDGLNGDGARVILARAGVELVEKYPWGLNAGRDAYQMRMRQMCGHTPALDFSHAHNAWINLALAVGVLGAFTFGWMLFHLGRLGLRIFRKNDESSVFGFALFMLSTFWLLRGMVDAVFQEHYLQMQAFMLLVLSLLGRSIQANHALKSGTR